MYKHFCEVLDDFDNEILINENELIETQTIKYKCKYDHINEMNLEAFKNKIIPEKLELIKCICKSCNINIIKHGEIINILKKLNFQFIKLDKGKDTKLITYKCHCGNISQTDLRNLKFRERKSQCPKCQNKKSNFDDIIKNFQDNGCQLLTKKEEYKNNKQKLDYKCSCGNESQIVYRDFKRGRRCMKCRYSK